MRKLSHTACMLEAMLTVSAFNLASSMHVPVRPQVYAAKTAILAQIAISQTSEWRSGSVEGP